MLERRPDASGSAETSRNKRGHFYRLSSLKETAVAADLVPHLLLSCRPDPFQKDIAQIGITTLAYLLHFCSSLSGDRIDQLAVRSPPIVSAALKWSRSSLFLLLTLLTELRTRSRRSDISFKRRRKKKKSGSGFKLKTRSLCKTLNYICKLQFFVYGGNYGFYSRPESHFAAGFDKNMRISSFFGYGAKYTNFRGT